MRTGYRPIVARMGESPALFAGSSDALDSMNAVTFDICICIALICGFATAAFLFIIGMPWWVCICGYGIGVGLVDKRDSSGRRPMIQAHLYVGDVLGARPDIRR